MLNRLTIAGIAVLILDSVASPTLTQPSYGSPVSIEIDLGYTAYRGVSLPAGVNQYLGIRFTAPPIGDLRWRAPADPPANLTVQDADSFGDTCLGALTIPGSNTSEDCLFANVFTPSNATTSSKLPVWLYIQGGGYVEDSNANYNGTQAIVSSNHSIVLVNFNYRVGAWGFLASENVRRDGDLNVGLLDQRKMMQWVKQYIAQFGGDPDHVVIHGASAGAGSVSYHLTAYGGRDDKLFVGAVPESPYWPHHPAVSEVEYRFDRFVANVSCDVAIDVMACLRSKNTSELQSANFVQPYATRINPPLWYWTPVVDGNFSQDTLYNSFERGEVVRVPTLVGDDTNEGSDFAVNASTSEQMLEFLKDNYPGLTASDLFRINLTYPLMAPLPEHAAWFPSSSAAFGDSTFTCPGNQIAASMAKYVGPDQVWNYRYDVADTGNEAAGLGTPHTFETPAIFGPPNGPCDGCSYETYNAPVVPLVMDYWISFVKTLDPNVYREAGKPYWQPWGTGGTVGRRLRFQLNDTAMEPLPAEQVSKCNLWRNLAEVMEQ